MKIERIRCYRPHRHNATFNQSNLVVLVETDTGLVGLGEGGSKDMLEQCAAMLIGADPFRTEALWQLMYRGWFYPPGREKLHALGALDLALWDLKGKALGVPVHQLLGGLCRNYIECYSHGTRGETLKERAKDTIESGFRAFRTAVADNGNGSYNSRRMVDKTVGECEEIRDGVGPDGDWCIDFHTRLDLADAVRCANLLEELNPLFIEDPLRSENPGVLADLRAQVHVPIAVGEHFGDRWDVNELIERRVIDYVRVTLPNTGGITEFMKIAALCETHYVGMVPHGTGPISTAALAHALGCFSGPVLQEHGGGIGGSQHLAEGPDFHDGKLWPNSRPGLGVTFKEQEATLIAEISEYSAPIPVFYRPDGSLTNW
jgi:galactonate dehydratase